MTVGSALRLAPGFAFPLPARWPRQRRSRRRGRGTPTGRGRAVGENGQSPDARCRQRLGSVANVMRVVQGPHAVCRRPAGAMEVPPGLCPASGALGVFQRFSPPYFMPHGPYRPWAIARPYTPIGRIGHVCGSVDGHPSSSDSHMYKMRCGKAQSRLFVIEFVSHWPFRGPSAAKSWSLPSSSAHTAQCGRPFSILTMAPPIFVKYGAGLACAANCL